MLNVKFIIRVSIVWTGLFILAFLNGAVREVGIKRFIAEPWAHHLSAVTAILLFSVYVFIVWKKTKIQTMKQAMWVGAFWFVLTILTETLILNRLIAKLSWEEIIQSYNLFDGNLWPVVLLWVGALPVMIKKIKYD